MECLIMTYGREFEPMAEVFFWFLHDFGISGYVHVLAQCECIPYTKFGDSFKKKKIDAAMIRWWWLAEFSSTALNYGSLPNIKYNKIYC